MPAVRPEPLPEPLSEVPPAPLAESCSPTVRFTAVTVPGMVVTSAEPSWANWAEARASWATVSADWSAVICSADASAVWSSLSLAWALSRLAWALAVAAASAVPSMVATTWPAVTVSPAFTLTAVTVPADEKFRLSVWAAATVPCAETVVSTVPVVTATSCFVVAAGVAVELSDRPVHHHTTPAATRATTTRTATNVQDRRDRRRCGAATPASAASAAAGGGGASASSSMSYGAP